MDYERERVRAEAQAKRAVEDQDWRMAAYHLFSAARATFRMAEGAEGRTRDSLVGLANAYSSRGDKALIKAKETDKKSASRKSDGAVKAEGSDSGKEWVLAERPSSRLEDVAGMEEMKELIQTHIILPMKYAEIYAEYGLQPGSGVLMYGPPGTGKTFIARAIAGEVDAAFIPVKMEKVLSKWFGETEQLLGELFAAAQQHPRTVIFFDEAESLFPKRGASNSSVMARVVPQLLQLINGLDASKNCIVLLGATNRPWLMDEAATRPGRFGRLVYIGPPDAAARAYLIERAMRGTPSEGLDFQRLAEMTEGYSGADLAGQQDSVCSEVKVAAIQRTVRKVEESSDAKTPRVPVTMADFEAVMKRKAPSIKQDDLKLFDLFREKSESNR